MSDRRVEKIANVQTFPHRRLLSGSGVMHVRKHATTAWIANGARCGAVERYK